MLSLPVYAFYDLETKIYDTPFFAKNEINAKRHFYISAKVKDSVLNTFPEKFELWMIGMFNTESGVIDNQKQCIYEGKQLIKDIDINE